LLAHRLVRAFQTTVAVLAELEAFSYTLAAH
jgi:hypothetical protein